jgi:hypothetical protein
MNHLTQKQILHRQYLQSPLWKKIRNKAIEHYGSICGKCGCEGNDVHHLSYDRAGGNEILEDLQVLCRECHEAIHVAERSTRKQKTKRRGCTIESLYSMLTYEHKMQIEEKYGGNAYSILTAPSDIGWKARKMARRFVNIQFIVGNLHPSFPVDKKQLNAINQFFFRQERKMLMDQGLLDNKKSKELRKKYFSC